MSAKGYVYRVFDAADRLLYVGCSVDVESRLRYHEQHSFWWIFRSRVETEEFPSRAEAAEAEVAAIGSEHPRWNKKDRTTPAPDLSYERDIALRYRALQQDERELIAELRRTRMALAGVSAEIAVVTGGGFEVDMSDIA